MPDINFGSPTVSGQISVSNTVDPLAASIAHSARTTTGTSTIGTVGSGKKWYVIGVQANIASAAFNNTFTATLALAGTAIIRLDMHTNATYGNGNATEAIGFSLDACPILEEGETATIGVTGGVNCSGTIIYVEVDA